MRARRSSSFIRTTRKASYIFSGPSTTSIDDGAWHYVTGRYDGSSLQVWVDGNLEASRSVSGVRMVNTNYGVELGGLLQRSHYEPYKFKGWLDEVRIYARALTPSEIRADMTTSVGGGTSPPADTTAPSTPTGLAATGVTTSQATISWQASTDNIGVTGYSVYRNGTFSASTTSTAFHGDRARG